MRATWLAAGAMILAAACGGEKAPAADTTAAAAPAAAAPATTGTVHEVQMAQVGAVLDAAIQNKMGPLQAQLISNQGETITISFAGAPAGRYKFTCLPHQATGMHGSITVQ